MENNNLVLIEKEKLRALAESFVALKTQVFQLENMLREIRMKSLDNILGADEFLQKTNAHIKSEFYDICKNCGEEYPFKTKECKGKM